MMVCSADHTHSITGKGWWEAVTMSATMALFGSGHPSMDPSKQFAHAFLGSSGAKHVIEHQSSHPISKAAKRSNKYLHGTPA